MMRLISELQLVAINQRWQLKLAQHLANLKLKKNFESL